MTGSAANSTARPVSFASFQSRDRLRDRQGALTRGRPQHYDVATVNRIAAFRQHGGHSKPGPLCDRRGPIRSPLMVGFILTAGPLKLDGLGIVGARRTLASGTALLLAVCPFSCRPRFSHCPRAQDVGHGSATRTGRTCRRFRPCCWRTVPITTEPPTVTRRPSGEEPRSTVVAGR